MKLTCEKTFFYRKSQYETYESNAVLLTKAVRNSIVLFAQDMGRFHKRKAGMLKEAACEGLSCGKVVAIFLKNRYSVTVQRPG